ncbi:MAG: hypothetical protein PHW62_00890 [Candidatus Ratteibacteria bacterium]|nr:hypothetical protein [Candidatus Ratteibacteria bacterium]
MGFAQFLKDLNEIGFGLVSANTYHIKSDSEPKPTDCMPDYYIYITVASGGDKGICYKREGLSKDADTMLSTLCEDIRQDVVMGLLKENGGVLKFGDLCDMVLALGRANYHGIDGSLFANRLYITLENLADKGKIEPIRRGLFKSDSPIKSRCNL